MAGKRSPLAERMSRVDASGIRKVFDLAASLDNPINLSIGQPDFDVPEPCKRRAIEAIRSGRNKYTVTQGEAALRERIGRSLGEEFGGFDGPVLVTSGVSGGILLALWATLDPGDEVIVPDPYFVMYKHLPRLVGARPVLVDTYPDFRLRAERLEAAVTERTRMLMNAHVRDCLVTGFEPLIAGLELPDPDDRHVLAAAIRAGADVIVTFNLDDFPARRLEPYGIEAQHPDDFISRLLALAPGAVCLAAKRHRESLRQPPKTVAEYLDCLSKQQLPQTVAKLSLCADML